MATPDPIKIGVSASIIYPDPDRAYFSKKTLACFELDMANYLMRSGVLPILVPKLPLPALREYVAALDGIVFQGGSDIAPGSYREEPIDPKRWPGDPQRDRYELDLMELAHKRGLPIFGICRGCQLINVFFGGTLYQDLATQKPDVGTHRDAALYDKVYHDVTWQTGGRLEAIYKDHTTVARVNSVHHQGIKDLAPPLQVEAVCPNDGTIEAISSQSPKDPLVLGVQWHPEFTASLGDTLIKAEPLYDYFIEEVKRCKTHSKS